MNNHINDEGADCIGMALDHNRWATCNTVTLPPQPCRPPSSFRSARPARGGAPPPARPPTRPPRRLISSLTILGLQGNDITGGGAAGLARGLEGNTTISELFLNDNQVRTRTHASRFTHLPHAAREACRARHATSPALSSPPDRRRGGGRAGAGAGEELEHRRAAPLQQQHHRHRRLGPRGRAREQHHARRARSTGQPHQRQRGLGVGARSRVSRGPVGRRQRRRVGWRQRQVQRAR